MLKMKLFASTLLIATVLFAQVGAVAAAAPAQETTAIAGTIQTITPETDTAGMTTIVVTLLDAQGATQTVRLTVETAVALGLVTLDAVTNAPVVVTGKIGQTVEIDPFTVIVDEPVVDEPVEVHPISAMLASFFGVDASVVDQYHQDGYGFGVIAQAMWMSQNLDGDATTAGLILEAKKTGDYSAFTLSDGSTPTNWGQFKKAVSEKKNNLGIVVSGKGENETTETTPVKEHGNGKEKSNNKVNGKGKP
jgi:hypothetical protein